MRPHFMILPSAACQARCSYCFGPNVGTIMQQDIFDLAVSWIDTMTPGQDVVDIAFHGGEPLLAGAEWYERNLPLLRQRFSGRLRLHVQSNLWLLDDALCALFKEYGVIAGTSLDGPEPVNDRQRGVGYYARTMRGIETALRHGIQAGVICTLTRQSSPHLDEVIAFYSEHRLPLQVHLVIASEAPKASDSLGLSPEEAGRVLTRLYDYYREHLDRLRIGTFDSILRSFAAGKGRTCTFTDCLGSYFAVTPDGGIFSCNRFCSDKKWQLGHVQMCPDLVSLSKSDAWAILARRESAVREACGDCSFYSICHGGCSFNALIAGKGTIDPHCEAYIGLFRRIADSALDDLFSEDDYATLLGSAPRKEGERRSALLRRMYDTEVLR